MSPHGTLSNKNAFYRTIAGTAKKHGMAAFKDIRARWIAEPWPVERPRAADARMSNEPAAGLPTALRKSSEARGSHQVRPRDLAKPT
jgi:hypothetical protein